MRYIFLTKLSTGLPPFNTTNIFSLVKKITNEQVVFPEEMNPQLKDLMLQKDPTKRIDWPDLALHPFICEIEEDEEDEFDIEKEVEISPKRFQISKTADSAVDVSDSSVPNFPVSKLPISNRPGSSPLKTRPDFELTKRPASALSPSNLLNSPTISELKEEFVIKSPLIEDLPKVQLKLDKETILFKKTQSIIWSKFQQVVESLNPATIQFQFNESISNIVLENLNLVHAFTYRKGNNRIIVSTILKSLGLIVPNISPSNIFLNKCAVWLGNLLKGYLDMTESRVETSPERDNRSYLSVINEIVDCFWKFDGIDTILVQVFMPLLSRISPDAVFPGLIGFVERNKNETSILRDLVELGTIGYSTMVDDVKLSVGYYNVLINSPLKDFIVPILVDLFINDLLFFGRILDEVDADHESFVFGLLHVCLEKDSSNTLPKIISSHKEFIKRIVHVASNSDAGVLNTRNNSVYICCKIVDSADPEDMKWTLERMYSLAMVLWTPSAVFNDVGNDSGIDFRALIELVSCFSGSKLAGLFECESLQMIDSVARILDDCKNSIQNGFSVDLKAVGIDSIANIVEKLVLMNGVKGKIVELFVEFVLEFLWYDINSENISLASMSIISKTVLVIQLHDSVAFQDRISEYGDERDLLPLFSGILDRFVNHSAAKDTNSASLVYNTICILYALLHNENTNSKNIECTPKDVNLLGSAIIDVFHKTNIKQASLIFGFLTRICLECVSNHSKKTCIEAVFSRNDTIEYNGPRKLVNNSVTIEAMFKRVFSIGFGVENGTEHVNILLDALDLLNGLVFSNHHVDLVSFTAAANISALLAFHDYRVQKKTCILFHLLAKADQSFINTVFGQKSTRRKSAVKGEQQKHVLEVLKTLVTETKTRSIGMLMVVDLCEFIQRDDSSAYDTVKNGLIDFSRELIEICKIKDRGGYKEVKNKFDAVKALVVLSENGLSLDAANLGAENLYDEIISMQPADDQMAECLKKMQVEIAILL